MRFGAGGHIAKPKPNIGEPISLVIWLSGPERTRAKAELALEDANLPIMPPGSHGVGPIKSYRAEDCQHLTQTVTGAEPDELQGFVAVLGPDESDSMNVAARAVESHGWVLRMHYQLPPEPKPDPIIATIDEMRRTIAELQAKAGV